MRVDSVFILKLLQVLDFSIDFSAQVIGAAYTFEKRHRDFLKVYESDFSGSTNKMFTFITGNP